MTNLLQAALEYAARGWPVFPAGVDKQPLVETGVIAATTNPEKIREWWARWPRANIGCNVGAADMMVLDFDPGHSLPELKANVAVPTTPLRQKTPRGGFHWFYALEPGEVVSNSASKLADRVDVRSFHGYVLLPPSRTVDGEYSWESTGKPAYRTDEMVRLSNTHREKSEDRDTWIIEPDLPENIAACIAWLKNDAKISIEGRGGDSNAYATAAMCKSYGISEPTAFELMWEHWNPRNVPPWGADEADHLVAKIANGYEYNTSPPGNMTQAYRVAKSQALFKPIQKELPTGKEVTSGRFRFVDRSGADHIRAPEWLIEGTLPAGAYAILYGDSGTFKSFIALDMAMSIASGTSFPWAGTWDGVTSQGNVLFCLGEGRPEFKKRIQAWEQEHWQGKPVNGIYLADPVPTVSEELEPFLNGAAAMSPTYKLIVIDTLGRAMQGANENAQEHASTFTRLVQVLQSTFDATILVLHHVGKDKEMRGSTVFRADADTVIRAEREPHAMVTTLTMVKQKDATEWEDAKLVSLKSVGDSLVAVKPEARQEQATPLAKAVQQNRRKGKNDPTRNDGAAMEIIDKAVAQVLAANPARDWSTRDLAEAVAVRPEIEVSSSRLRQASLVDLREQSGTVANAAYDPMKKRWRHPR